MLGSVGPKNISAKFSEISRKFHEILRNIILGVRRSLAWGVRHAAGPILRFFAKIYASIFCESWRGVRWSLAWGLGDAPPPTFTKCGTVNFCEKFDAVPVARTPPRVGATATTSQKGDGAPRPRRPAGRCAQPRGPRARRTPPAQTTVWRAQQVVAQQKISPAAHTTYAPIRPASSGALKKFRLRRTPQFSGDVATSGRAARTLPQAKKFGLRRFRIVRCAQ